MCSSVIFIQAYKCSAELVVSWELCWSCIFHKKRIWDSSEVTKFSIRFRTQWVTLYLTQAKWIRSQQPVCYSKILWPSILGFAHQWSCYAWIQAPLFNGVNYLVFLICYPSSIIHSGWFTSFIFIYLYILITDTYLPEINSIFNWKVLRYEFLGIVLNVTPAFPKRLSQGDYRESLLWLVFLIWLNWLFW